MIPPIVTTKKNGVEKQYYDDGRIMREFTNSDGKIISSKTFDENGNETKKGN
jgi:antitoxin component YwqK of YwqJK toxin-antitoxin module